MHEISNIKMFFLTLGGMVLIAYDWIKKPFKRMIDPKNMTPEQRRLYLLNLSLQKKKDLK